MIVVRYVRGDVHHHQPTHPLRGAEREAHGGLAAHAVSDQGGGLDALALHQLEDVLRHLGIAHGVRVGRLAVVAQVQREHPVVGAQAPGDGTPVAAGAEQPVEDEQGRAGRALGPEVQGDTHPGASTCAAARRGR